MFYVYEWFIVETNEIIYVGKGCKNRYKTINKNKMFREFLNRFNCSSRIVNNYNTETEAFEAEGNRIKELKNIGQAVCNIYTFGAGGVKSCWNEERRKEKSINNPMKSAEQRERMSKYNPMKNHVISEKVSSQRKKSVVLNGIKYESTFMAKETTGYCEASIKKWCERGYDKYGNPCRYAKEEQKDYIFTRNNKGSCRKVEVDGNVFDSMLEAAISLGCSTSSNLLVALKSNKPFKGHNVRYVDNQKPSNQGID